MPASDPTIASAPAATMPDVDTGVQPPSGDTPPGGVRFAVVRGGKANPDEGFTITRTGEFLVGRTDTESANTPDIDLRQWVQPLDIHGTKQYLVHRKQCFLGLAPNGAVTIRACPGAELDTLVKPVGKPNFTPLNTFGSVRNMRPDDSYELDPGDQIYMGDPDALGYFQSGDSTAQGSYLVLELLGR